MQAKYLKEIQYNSETGESKIVKTLPIVVDIETLGTRPGSVILSIAAVVAFYSNVPGNKFTINITSQSCTDVGLRTDPSTIAWWDNQPKEIIEAVTENAFPIKTALAAFNLWVEAMRGKYPDLMLTFWGNGADFDIPMLREAYLATSIEHPFGGFRTNRCLRTYVTSNYEFFDRELLLPPANKHTALADAEHEARILESIVGAKQYD